MNEALGVPQDLLKKSKTLLTKVVDMVSEFQPDESEEDEKEETHTFVDEDFNMEIAGENFHTLKLYVSVKKGIVRKEHTENVVLMGYGVMSGNEFDTETGRLQKVFDGDFMMSLSFASKRDFTIKDLVDCIYDREDLASSFAHEIKHIYDHVYKQSTSVYGMSVYDTYTKLQRGTPVLTISNFMYNCYYTTIQENLVRPSEMAGAMEDQGITKNNFKDWFHESNIIQKLIEIREDSFDKFYERLLNEEINEVKAFLEDFFDMDQFESDEDVVYCLLEFVCQNFYSLAGNEMFRISTSGLNFLDVLTNNIPEKVEQMKTRISKEAKKYIEDPVRFFEEKINRNSRSADKMIKKLAGLYALAQDEDLITTNEVKTFTQFKLNEELNPKEFFINLVNIFKNINNKIKGIDKFSNYRKISQISNSIFESVTDEIIKSVAKGQIRLEDVYTHLINDLTSLVNELDQNLRSDTFGISLNLPETIIVNVEGRKFIFTTLKLLRFLVLGDRNLSWPGIIGFLDSDSILSKNYSGGMRNNFSHNKSNFLNHIEKNKSTKSNEIVEKFLNTATVKMIWFVEDELGKIPFESLEKELNSK